MKLIKTILSVFTLVVLTATVAQAQSHGSGNRLEAKAVMVKTKVKGITCSKDLKMISDNVLKLEGVMSCQPGKKGPTTTFLISYDPALVSEQQINETIQNTGSCENPKERPYKVKTR